MNRRTLLAGLGTGGVMSLAGCLGMVGLDQHEAAAAGVEADAREQTGYHQTGIDDIVVDRSVGIGPLSETIKVTNKLTEHEKTIDMGLLGRRRGAVFTVLSSPKVSVAGQQFNPIEDMSPSELIGLIESNYDGIEDINFDEENSATILEQETVQSRFTATAEFDGRSIDVYIHVSEAVEMEDDLVVTIGVYPQNLQNQEEQNILTLMEAVTPDVEETDSSESPDDENSSTDGDGNGSDDTNGSNSDDGDGIVSAL
jgi:hypothetical protein